MDDPRVENLSGSSPSVCILGNYFYRWRNEFPDGFNSCSTISEILKGAGEKIEFFGHVCELEEPQKGAVEERETDWNVLKDARRTLFNKSASIEPDEFEQKWRRLEENFESDTTIESPLGPTDFEFMEILEKELAEEGIFCIASGETSETSFKLFSYCEANNKTVSERIYCLSETRISRLPSKSRYQIVFRAKGCLGDQDQEGLEVSCFCEEVWTFLVSFIRRHIRQP